MWHALFYKNNLILIWYLKNPSKHTLDMAIQSREKVTNRQKLNLLLWVFGAGWLDCLLCCPGWSHPLFCPWGSTVKRQPTAQYPKTTIAEAALGHSWSSGMPRGLGPSMMAYSRLVQKACLASHSLNFKSLWSLLSKLKLSWVQ